jgi:uncharacterized protein
MKPSQRVVMRPAWHDLLFLHWETDADALARLLPPGLQLDTFEGRAYVGLVPFTMTGVRPRGLPHLPPLRGVWEDFHETNVRTYVRHPHGRGVWFFSLDAASAPAVVAARGWYKLPYFYAHMKLQKQGDVLRYGSRRLWPSPTPAECQISVVPQGEIAPAVPGTLEYFLVERYLLYSFSRGQLFAGRVHHKPYQIQSAQVLSLQENLIAAANIVRPDTPPLAHFSRGVRVDILGLHRVD